MLKNCLFIYLWSCSVFSLYSLETTCLFVVTGQDGLFESVFNMLHSAFPSVFPSFLCWLCLFFLTTCFSACYNKRSKPSTGNKLHQYKNSKMVFTRDDQILLYTNQKNNVGITHCPTSATHSAFSWVGRLWQPGMFDVQ